MHDGELRRADALEVLLIRAVHRAGLAGRQVARGLCEQCHGGADEVDGIDTLSGHRLHGIAQGHIDERVEEDAVPATMRAHRLSQLLGRGDLRQALDVERLELELCDDGTRHHLASLAQRVRQYVNGDRRHGHGSALQLREVRNAVKELNERIQQLEPVLA